MRIFVSYRREDASAWAGRLRDALSAHFGEDNIFQDVVAVQPGQDFTDAVDAALSRSDAALAVIGPQWLTAAGIDGESRLAARNDYVRSELVTALAHTRRWSFRCSSAGRQCPPPRNSPTTSNRSHCCRR
jgi:hypothetical protein